MRSHCLGSPKPAHPVARGIGVLAPCSGIARSHVPDEPAALGVGDGVFHEPLRRSGAHLKVHRCAAFAIDARAASATAVAVMPSFSMTSAPGADSPNRSMATMRP